MFRIRISVVPMTVEGLDALDMRRRFKLPDDSRLRVRDDCFREAEVSEGFARIHFERTAVDVFRWVKVDQLAAGELTVRTADAVGLSPDLSADRIRELWLANG